MPGATVNRGYPYPFGTEQINVHGDIQKLAEAIDLDVDSLSANDPSVTTAGMIGEIRMWGGTTAPPTWSLCQGQAVSRSTYAALFAVYSTRFGAGDGSTTFNLPNFQATLPVGVNANVSPPSGVAGFTTLGGRGGMKDQIVVSHNHTGPAHTHTFSGTTSTIAAHTHDMGEQPVLTHFQTGGPIFLRQENVNPMRVVATLDDTQAAGAHSHTFSGTTSSSGTGVTSTVGSDGTNDNYPPSLAVHFICKML